MLVAVSHDEGRNGAGKAPQMCPNLVLHGLPLVLLFLLLQPFDQLFWLLLQGLFHRIAHRLGEGVHGILHFRSKSSLRLLHFLFRFGSFALGIQRRFRNALLLVKVRFGSLHGCLDLSSGLIFHALLCLLGHTVAVRNGGNDLLCHLVLHSGSQ